MSVSLLLRTPESMLGNVRRLFAAAFRFWNTGSWASEAAPSFCIAGFSCSRKPGSLSQVRVMLVAWVAESVERESALTMKRWTSWLFFASAVITESALTFSCLIVCASFASSASRLSVCASAGSARLSAT